MTTQDPISDMIISIKNGQIAKKKKILIPLSKFKISIAILLKKEGFIKNYKINNNVKPKLKIYLKYFKGKSVIENIKRISKPGLRIYKKKNKLPKIRQGMGMAIISTSKGLMSDFNARKYGFGGEIICYVE